MRSTRLLKALLGVSVLAALFAAQAQSSTTATARGTGSGQSATAGSQSGTSQGAAGQSRQGTSTQGSIASGTSAGVLGKTDRTIVTNMALANMAEIEQAKLAQTKSQNEQIKNYAQQMIDDHTKALTEVQQLAQAKGVTLPTELDKTSKARLEKLSGMSGEAFDKAYLSQAGVTEHKNVHGMLLQAHVKAKDPDVKVLAARSLPTVDQHLNAAQQLNAKQGGAPKTGKSPAASRATAQRVM